MVTSRQGRAARDADRLRQIALLSASRDHAAAARRWSISPLIALMEDQVAKLQIAGVRRRAHPLGPRPGRLARGLPRVS